MATTRTANLPPSPPTIEVSDRSASVAAEHAQRAASVARGGRHQELLAVAITLLESTTAEGGTLFELGQTDPLAAAEMRARWETIAAMATEQLRAARSGGGSSIRASLINTAKKERA